MTTTEQQACATGRESVERLARWMWPEAHLDHSAFWHEKSETWLVWLNDRDGMRRWNPFTNPTDERELLTAVQERWGRPAHTEGREPEASMWWALHRALMQTFSRRYADEDTDDARNISQAMFWLLFTRAGDIARAVDEVLREYPEIA